MNIIFLLFVLTLVAIVGLANTLKSTPNIQGDQGALWVNLNGYLADNREESVPLEQVLRELNGQPIERKISTFDLVYSIESAADDERIRGLVLNLNDFSGADLPALDYVGQAIRHFKEKNKQVIAISDNYSQTQYYLASFADQIYLNPIGSVSINGFSQERLFFKSTLEKLEITPHIFRVGTYKSAVEPFLRDNMSPESRTNTQQWLNKMWDNYLVTVAENRQITPQQLFPPAKQYLAELKALNGDSAAYTKQRGLISELITNYDLDKKLTALFGKDENGEVKSVSFDDYLSVLPDRMQSAKKEKIAVVNIEGAIIDGESVDEEVGGYTIASLLRQANDDDNIKAVILRINSPGGSAFASEIIRQEVEHIQKNGKPVVVSMGQMAASGGYWIAAGADYIIADQNTITGSIGIFSIFPTFEKSIQKLGIYSDGVKTSELAETSALSPLSKSVSDIYQLELEHGYQQFLTIVSKGRNLSLQEVDKIAQGRIWLGQEAYRNKLVDELGDFSKAVEKAGELVRQKMQGNEQLGVEWLIDDSSNIVNKWLRELKRGGQQYALSFFGLPKEAEQVRNQLNQLNQFNDPKGQYLYCLTCAAIK
ncbi:signal peptide peptidase SppA [Rodentibacter caecimuris]|uniref:Signal peptide peptidase SppA n=2 Tax=Rodentibacter caecimuris TaxID=1796644 RepID=A0ABX3KYA3_9PAST|nr:signal peptide peptidase SppA [Rodentibacter heylii]